MRLLPPGYKVSSIQKTSTFLRDNVSTTSQTLPLRVFTLSVPTLNFLGCLLVHHNGLPPTPDRRKPSWRHYQWSFYVYWRCLTFFVITIKILEHLIVFTRLPVLADILLSSLTASENCLVLINKAEKFICHSNSRSTSCRQEQTTFLLPEV